MTVRPPTYNTLPTDSVMHGSSALKLAHAFPIYQQSSICPYQVSSTSHFIYAFIDAWKTNRKVKRCLSLLDLQAKEGIYSKTIHSVVSCIFSSQALHQTLPWLQIYMPFASCRTTNRLSMTFVILTMIKCGLWHLWPW